jgi:hypothetical protein
MPARRDGDLGGMGSQRFRFDGHVRRCVDDGVDFVVGKAEVDDGRLGPEPSLRQVVQLRKGLRDPRVGQHRPIELRYVPVGCPDRGGGDGVGLTVVRVPVPPYATHWDAGAVVLELYEKLVEHRTQGPTFYTDFPTSVSPLTRPHRSRPGLAERWDLVAWGVELGTAYSELTDPVEQRRRLQEQSLLAAGGNPEAMELDEDFLRAMEYAMPPTGGLGMGVDRVVMLITGRSIRETLPFPLAKPR